MTKFKPDFLLAHYSVIDIEWLRKNGIQTILSDIDSTLAAHDEAGNHDLKVWIQSLKNAGIELILVSNNNEQRVKSFANQFDVTGYSKCSKPGTNKIKEVIGNNRDKHNILFLGDQIFTDIWCGKRLGVKTALVKPVGEHQPLQIKLKRFVEKLLMKFWALNYVSK